MAFFKINAPSLLSQLCNGGKIEGDVKITGASYDAATDKLIINIMGKGLLDFAEVEPERYAYTEVRTSQWCCSGTRFKPVAQVRVETEKTDASDS